MQKLSASPKSQYSPWCCTVQMAGVSAYQSECCHGARRGSEKEKLLLHAVCSTLSDCFWLLSFFPPNLFSTKKQQGKDWVMLRSGKLAPWEGSKHGKITTGSVAGPSMDSTRVQVVCLVYSHPVTQHLPFKKSYVVHLQHDLWMKTQTYQCLTETIGLCRIDSIWTDW